MGATGKYMFDLFVIFTTHSYIENSNSTYLGDIIAKHLDCQSSLRQDSADIL